MMPKNWNPLPSQNDGIFAHFPLLDRESGFASTAKR